VQAGTLIELGEDRSVAAVDRPGRPRSGRTVMLLVLVVALALLGGGQAAPRSRITAVATVPTRSLTAALLTPATLYVAEDSGLLTAYALPAGRARWRVRLVDTPRTIRSVTDAGILLVTTSSEVGGAARLVAVDSGTGAVLWSQRQAMVVDVPPGGRVLVERPADADPGRAELRSGDLRTGAVTWSRLVPASADVAASHDPGRPDSGALLVTDADGTAQLLAEDTGTVLARGAVGSLVGNLVLTPGPPGGVPAPVGERAPVSLLGGEFLVQHRRNTGTGWLTAFDLDTLAELWSVSGDLLGTPFRCGRALCLGGAAGVRAVDPATGALRWSTSYWQYASPLGEDRLLGYGPHGFGVLDAGTGRMRGEVGAAWTRVLLNGARPPLVSRPDADRYWFALLRLDPVTTEPLGYLTGVDGPSCQVSGDLLACLTTRGTLGVWRVATASI
jgi:outer membrane protein assembly factor BamB